YAPKIRATTKASAPTVCRTLRPPVSQVSSPGAAGLSVAAASTASASCGFSERSAADAVDARPGSADLSEVGVLATGFSRVGAAEAAAVMILALAAGAVEGRSSAGATEAGWAASSAGQSLALYCAITGLKPPLRRRAMTGFISDQSRNFPILIL